MKFASGVSNMNFFFPCERFSGKARILQLPVMLLMLCLVCIKSDEDMTEAICISVCAAMLIQ